MRYAVSVLVNCHSCLQWRLPFRPSSHRTQRKPKCLATTLSFASRAREAKRVLLGSFQSHQPITTFAFRSRSGGFFSRLRAAKASFSRDFSGGVLVYLLFVAFSPVSGPAMKQTITEWFRYLREGKRYLEDVDNRFSWKQTLNW